MSVRLTYMQNMTPTEFNVFYKGVLLGHVKAGRNMSSWVAYTPTGGHPQYSSLVIRYASRSKAGQALYRWSLIHNPTTEGD